MNDRRWVDLVSGFLDDRLGEEELRDLQNYMLDDPAVAEAFVASCIDEAKIADWATGENFRYKARDPDTNDVAFAPGEQRESSGIRYRSVATLFLVILAGVAGLWWANLPTKLGRITADMEAVAHQGFFWRTVREGRRLQLDQGVVEIETDQQVRVVLEAPLDCEFESLQQLRLLRGRAYVEVPESGHGFTIATPNGKIIDLGTAFGVEVNKDKTTEVHVFEGTVSATAQFDEEILTADVVEGHAVVFNRKTQAIDKIAMSQKFVRQTSPLVESFSLKRLPQQDSPWFDLEGQTAHPRLRQESIQYQGLAPSEGGMLEILLNEKTAPETIGRRWHHRYCSFLVYPDDDFPKRMESAPATLVSFGSLEGPYESIARLVVARQNRQSRQSVDFGLIVDGISQYDNDRQFQGFKPCLVVLQFGEDQIDAWINPQVDSLGSKIPPPPDLKVERLSGTRIEAIWINDPGNPLGITWYFLDELRGGNTWAEVTPREFNSK